MNPALFLAVLADVAIGLQVVANSMCIKSLGIGGLVAISRLTTGVIGFAFASFTTRPEFASKAVTAAVASGLLGAFIVSAITVAVVQSGLAQTLSLVIGSQLLVGLVLDRLGVFEPDAADIGVIKVLGVVFILIGGTLVVRG